VTVSNQRGDAVYGFSLIYDGFDPGTEVLREALRRYSQEKRWRRLKRYGAGQARKAGLTAAGVGRAVQEYRRGR